MSSGEGGGDPMGGAPEASGKGGGPSGGDSKGSGVGETGALGGGKGDSSAPSMGDPGGLGSGFGTDAGAGPMAFSGDTGGGGSGLDSWLAAPDAGAPNLADPGPVGGAPDLFTGPMAPSMSASAYAAPAGVGGNADLTGGGSGPFTMGDTTFDVNSANEYIAGLNGGAVGTAPVQGSSGDLAALTGGGAGPAANGGNWWEGGSTDGVAAPAGGGGALPATPFPAAGTGAAPAAVASKPDGGGLFSGFNDFKVTPGTALGGIGLLNNLINGNQTSPNVSALNNIAASNMSLTQGQTDAGKALQQFLSNGTLPEGYEAQVQQGANAAKQRILSNHAGRGLPIDPAKNSVLAQELSQVDAQLPAMREQLAKTLFDAGSSLVQQGLSATGISSNVYSALAKLEDDKQKARGAAIANFAAALNGGTKPKAA